MTMHPKRNHTVIASVLAIVVAGALFICLQSREPEYEGKKLSAWLGDYVVVAPRGTPRPRIFLDKSARDAVRHIGTNAIPALLEMFRHREPPWKLRLLELAQKLPRVTVYNLSGQPSWVRAIDGLSSLGPIATNAIPGLIEIYSQNLPSQAYVVMALGRLGWSAPRQVFPVLLRAATGTNWEAQGVAVLYLPSLPEKTDEIVRALITGLNSPHPNARRNAVIKLGDFGPDASQAVPALSKLVDDIDPVIRNGARRAIAIIAPATAAGFEADGNILPDFLRPGSPQ